MCDTGKHLFYSIVVTLALLGYQTLHSQNKFFFSLVAQYTISSYLLQSKQKKCFQNTIRNYYTGFPNRGDMILNVPIGLI